jgi:hypothetical protein
MRSRIPLLLIVFVGLFAIPEDIVGMEAVTGAAANRETAKNELALAEASRKRAAEAGAEWLETGSLIEQASDAFENEDWSQALTLARRAKKQGQLAIEQAERESIAWRDRVIQ